ncbi:MAG: hypothetical protein BWK79_10190 [Beggiatoa sp. IS2]|nr:MAG: hypothetical protein BWK79_10190 [Beggiatoa sp. IS2]
MLTNREIILGGVVTVISSLVLLYVDKQGFFEPNKPLNSVPISSAPVNSVPATPPVNPVPTLPLPPVTPDPVSANATVEPTNAVPVSPTLVDVQQALAEEIQQLEKLKQARELEEKRLEGLRQETIIKQQLVTIRQSKEAESRRLAQLRQEQKRLEQSPITSDTVIPSKIFRDLLKDGSEGPEMVVIPEGKFRIGDLQKTGNSDEKPVHAVTIQSFAIGRYEITFVEYDRFVQATGRKLPSDEGWGRGNRPVINVSWSDAVAYIDWLSQQTGKPYRLPTEAEWEYAARGGTETDYWWGNTASHEYANYGKDECCEGLVQGKDQWVFTSPVGSFKPNPFGLYDTAGNVWEWTCSLYTTKYESGKEQGCLGKSVGISPVFRGGSWSADPRWLRVAYRNWHDSRYLSVGIRLARDV